MSFTAPHKNTSKVLLLNDYQEMNKNGFISILNEKLKEADVLQPRQTEESLPSSVLQNLLLEHTKLEYRSRRYTPHFANQDLRIADSGPLYCRPHPDHFYLPMLQKWLLDDHPRVLIQRWNPLEQDLFSFTNDIQRFFNIYWLSAQDVLNIRFQLDMFVQQNWMYVGDRWPSQGLPQYISEYDMKVVMAEFYTRRPRGYADPFAIPQSILLAAAPTRIIPSHPVVGTSRAAQTLSPVPDQQTATLAHDQVVHPEARRPHVYKKAIIELEQQGLNSVQNDIGSVMHQVEVPLSTRLTTSSRQATPEHHVLGNKITPQATVPDTQMEEPIQVTTKRKQSTRQQRVKAQGPLLPSEVKDNTATVDKVPVSEDLHPDNLSKGKKRPAKVQARQSKTAPRGKKRKV